MALYCAKFVSSNVSDVNTPWIIEKKLLSEVESSGFVWHIGVVEGGDEVEGAVKGFAGIEGSGEWAIEGFSYRVTNIEGIDEWVIEGVVEGVTVMEGFIVIDGNINGNVVNHSTNFIECFPSM